MPVPRDGQQNHLRWHEDAMCPLRLMGMAVKVFVCCFAVIAITPGAGLALYAEMHAALAYDAAFVSGVPGEIISFAGEPGYCTSRATRSICNGAYDEDAERDPRLTSDPGAWIGLMGWGTHFWDPTGGPHGGRLMTVGALPANIEGVNAYERAASLYDAACALYPLDPARAYELLGRVVHLLTDMSTPAHVHLDPHISSSNSTGDDSYEEFTAARYVRNGVEEGLALLSADYPPASLAVVPAAELPDGGYPEEPPLFRLFLSMASSASRFDSDDADGLSDRGWRRGVSIAYPFEAFLYATIYGATDEYLLPPFFYQVSPSRRQFILSMYEMQYLSRNLSVEGVRLHFEEGVVQYPLSAFSRTDMGDGDLGAVAAALLPAALERTASLYRLFWEDTHPSIVPAEAPEILLSTVPAHDDISPPAPLDMRIDLDPRGWNTVETEVYIWASLAGAEGVGRFFFNGTWHPLVSFAELTPIALSYRLTNLHNISWRVFQDTSLVAGSRLTFTVCVDRILDGSFSPADSVCGALPVSVRPLQ